MRKWLKDIRNEAKKSQQSVSDSAGISQSYYAGIEDGSRGKHMPVTVAKKIANVLGFPWTRFYEELDQKKEVTELNNLAAEMARFCISTSDIQAVIGCSDKTVRNKLSGATEFTISEAMKIRNQLFPSFRIEYLFATNEQYPSNKVK